MMFTLVPKNRKRWARHSAAGIVPLSMTGTRYGNSISTAYAQYSLVEIKRRFRKRVVLANVPSFRFLFRGNIRQNHPFGNHPFRFLRNIGERGLNGLDSADNQRENLMRKFSINPTSSIWTSIADTILVAPFPRLYSTSTPRPATKEESPDMPKCPPRHTKCGIPRNTPSDTPRNAPKI